ncbi:hypothetical protein AB0G08_29520, partial [Micromonospora sp. NPDC023644]
MTAPDLLTVGEALVSLRSAGPLAAGGPLTMHLAGAESNVAVAVGPAGPPPPTGRRGGPHHDCG